jgi:Leucine-rich repeat (LRR) protein
MRKIIVWVVLIAMAGMLVPSWYFMFYGPSSPAPTNSAAPISFIGSKEYQNLSGQGLTLFPQQVLRQVNLEELDLSDNNLTGAFPAEIRGLTKLKVLRAGNNQLTGIPAEIGQLSRLEILDFSFNQITGLPLEIVNLKNLKVINLRGNNVSSQDLEAIMAGLPELKIIL